MKFLKTEKTSLMPGHVTRWSPQSQCFEWKWCCLAHVTPWPLAFAPYSSLPLPSLHAVLPRSANNIFTLWLIKITEKKNLKKKNPSKNVEYTGKLSLLITDLLINHTDFIPDGYAPPFPLIHPHLFIYLQTWDHLSLKCSAVYYTLLHWETFSWRYVINHPPL